MIGFLKGLTSLRNVAILSGLLATAFAVQSLRIKSKNSKIDALKSEIASLEITVSKFDESQQTNLTTIAELRQVNQQCAAGKQINEANSKQELTRQQQRIADITNKYDELRKQNIQKMGCYSVRIDPNLLEQLYENKIYNKD